MSTRKLRSASAAEEPSKAVSGGSDTNLEINLVNAAVFLVATLSIIPAAWYASPVALTDEDWSLLLGQVRVAIGCAFYAWVAGEATGNVSQVDKLWSIVPAVYVAVAAWYGGFTPRLQLLLAVVAVWSLRLSYNFYRNGGFELRFWSGQEDYRWAVVRARPELSSRFRWFFFHLLFICVYQNALLLFMVMPTLLVFQNRNAPLTELDFALAAVYVLLVVVEATADQQQHDFQQLKKKNQTDGKKFVTTGLWAYCRHPNYLAEISIWLTFYFIGAAASRLWFNWTIAGFLLLLTLFRESSRLTERGHLNKYPEYSKYRATVWYPLI